MVGAMRTFVALALVAAATPAVAADRTYSVTDFDRVSVEGPYVVRLVTGRPSAARASGPTASLDRLVIDVNGQTLRIRRNRDYWGGNDGAQEGVVTIELATRSLRSGRLIGPGTLAIDRLQGLRVDIAVEGSGRLTATNVAADNLSLGLAGSGRIDVAGAVDTLTADVQGSGDIDAARLVAQDARLTTTTSGTVALSAARTASVTALGLGSVTISGRAACTFHGTGADQVRCGAAAPAPTQRTTPH